VCATTKLWSGKLLPVGAGDAVLAAVGGGDVSPGRGKFVAVSGVRIVAVIFADVLFRWIISVV